MTAFDEHADLEDPAFRLLSSSAVTLFWQATVLEDTVGALRAYGYQVVSLNASGWTADERMHDDISAALGFPSYYGRNLDALNDCLADVVAGDYGWEPDSTGLVLVLIGYDVFATQRRTSAQVMLDIVARRSREALLIGRRLLCLVQSDDPAIEFDGVGATPVVWNPAEWLASRRQP
ncbi:MAG TPA: barstar family protein [Micromonosporaceae bacterium]|nr:barstar family protein [Micromonosporaceae bacterium]